MSIIEVSSLGKCYGQGETAVQALRDASLDVQDGEFVAVSGPSGRV